jgi:hypothetical protein
MANSRTRGVIRPNKAYAIFRIVFGLFFIGLGINQYSRFPSLSLPYFSLGIGGLFVIYGILGVVAEKTTGNRIELESVEPTAADRLEELSKLKSGNLISEAEYETKRQEILKTL